jgi:hypothetical protein
MNRSWLVAAASAVNGCSGCASSLVDAQPLHPMTAEAAATSQDRFMRS